ncbi:30S ribosomal protein S20 [Candidatus Microgenomates bacterium]|nr:30S ribosomal protein S20 [Candidatus Microgenomates bacterium]
MPILKSAIKKLRQSTKKRERNLAAKSALKNLLDAFKKKPTPGVFSKLTSALDRAAKKNLIHRNKAARLKSRLSRLLKTPKK